MQAGEALSSWAARLGAEVGHPQSSHAWALCGICCFAPGTAARSPGSPSSRATRLLRGLVGTPHALPVFPAQLAAASLGFPAMPSQRPRGPCLLPK